ncbi:MULTISPECIES: HAD-IIA family hydrolase [Sellimonas]|uniref:Acid sugar phosphatase n=1 Tax=Sellimonas caecigallum TaxID=2592333 RepID=A0ABS7L689_9FIRM|nr:HAD-IIA family hydrolase [Sellimonas caecigallum]MBY0758566.1 HAD-IIA family hydrolase [Sellimonas caecigallum]OUP64792.1 haloacid dehalogenase [Drancourtella sp. An177]
MLGEKKYFLFDIDGTLAVDTTLYDGTKEFLEWIEETGGRCFYITNNSTKSRKDYVEKFKNWGIRTEESQFMTASYAACLYLKKYYEGKKIFVLGTPSFIKELKEAGILVTEKAEDHVDCVLVGFDSTLNYDKMTDACRLLFQKEVDFLGTNPDLRCPASFGFIPDCGAICRMLEVTAGRKPYFIGKPNRLIADLCMQQCKGSPEEYLVVGDRLYTDIACGIEAGIETAVVYTGEADPEEVRTSIWKPDYAFDTIRQLYDAVRKARGEGAGR